MGRLHYLMLLSAGFFSTLLLAQAMSAAAGMTVKVSTTPIFSKIPRAQTNKDIQVLLRIEAPPPVDLKGRVPIDLVMVLDVGGGTVSLEPVKKAMKFAIRQLSDEDSVAIFGPPMSREVIPKFMNIHGSRRIAEKKVDELEGRRFAHPARSSLDEALKMLEEQSASSSVGRAKFIVFVTDITRFSSDMPELSKYPVHAYGLGASHDAAALRLIAQRSQGTYSFLDDANADKVAAALALCLGGLKSVAAIGARVVLKAASGSGVRIDRISSGGYASSIAQGDRASGEIAIGALYAGEVKSFVVHLDVPAAPETSPGERVCCDQQQLLVASLDGQLYTSGGVGVVDDDAAAGGGGPIQNVLVVERPPAAVLPKVPSAIVVNHIFQFRMLEMVDAFINDEILLRRTPATTGRTKDVDVDDDLGTKLLARWERFVLEHQFWVGLDLGSLDGEITAVANSLRKQNIVGVSSSMAAYIFSWMSSYKMQRPTAMGSPAKVVGVFVTLEVHLTLQVAITAENGGGGGGGDGECHDECEYSCVEQLPPAPPLLVASGRDDDSYRFNAAYEGVISLDDINQFMIKIYQVNIRFPQGMVKANNLKQCHLMNQQPRAVA
uniref:Zinc finger-like n=1 Tax=Oryza rufipogon TaxID=4529 RepID=A0A679BCK0_ORYRU|nr:zinc finger-like [Oryza rufipogon]